MPLTNPAVGADVYVALEEQAIGCIIETVMQQRPSLFNYATAGFIAHPELLYQPIIAHPAVTARNNILIKELDQPLPVFGTRFLDERNLPDPGEGQEKPKLAEYYSLNYYAQVTAVQVDFSPGNVIVMPEGLPTLPEQHFAVRLAVAAGVGFPSSEFDLLQAPPTEDLPALAPFSSICAFPMEIVLMGYVTRNPAGAQKPLSIGIDDFEIVDLQPSGLECLLESYVKMELRSVIIPQVYGYLRQELPGLILRIVIKKKPDSPIDLPKAVDVTITPTCAEIPRNPSFADDTLTAYAQLVEVEE